MVHRLSYFMNDQSEQAMPYITTTKVNRLCPSLQTCMANSNQVEKHESQKKKVSPKVITKILIPKLGCELTSDIKD